MNKKSKFLQTEFSAGEYLAPRVKVVEVKPRRGILTGSDYLYETTSGTEENDY